MYIFILLFLWYAICIADYFIYLKALLSSCISFSPLVFFGNLLDEDHLKKTAVFADSLKCAQSVFWASKPRTEDPAEMTSRFRLHDRTHSPTALTEKMPPITHAHLVEAEPYSLEFAVSDLGFLYNLSRCSGSTWDVKRHLSRLSVHCVVLNQYSSPWMCALVEHWVHSSWSWGSISSRPLRLGSTSFLRLTRTAELGEVLSVVVRCIWRRRFVQFHFFNN